MIIVWAIWWYPVELVIWQFSMFWYNSVSLTKYLLFIDNVDLGTCHGNLLFIFVPCFGGILPTTLFVNPVVCVCAVLFYLINYSYTHIFFLSNHLLHMSIFHPTYFLLSLTLLHPKREELVMLRILPSYGLLHIQSKCHLSYALFPEKS